MSYLPENYRESVETTAFQQALQPEVNLMWAARDALLEQLNLWTATWGLRYWEDALGLSACDGIPLDTRRRQVAAKLQGRATTTPQVLKDVAETLLGVSVRVVELFGLYTVLLETAPDTRPGAGAGALRERLKDIMPAHLDWQVVFPMGVTVAVGTSLGVRLSQSTLPGRARTLPGLYLPCGAALGGRMSVTTLPTRAEGGQEDGL